MRGIQTGHVALGAMNTMGPMDISLVLADFHERHPQVELTVREDNSEALAEKLRADVLDLAFLSVTERVESHGLGLQQILMEELVVVLPENHALAGLEADQDDRTREASSSSATARVPVCGSCWSGPRTGLA